MTSTSLVLLVPGRLDTRTGGYEYDRRVAAGLRARGWTVDVRELDGNFPHPSAAARDQAACVLSTIPDGSIVLVDGLALGSLPVEAERHASRLKIVALVHLPLAAEIGLDRATADRLEMSERRALAAAALVVVTGKSTVDALARYGVARDRVAVVEPGTDRASLSRGSRGPDLRLLCVAAITAGKGHEVLFRALNALEHRGWLLTCAGSLDREPATVEGLRRYLRSSGLEDRVSLVGELDAEALEACYGAADVFVLATLHETYCMAVAEALAHGLPVISTTTGAIPELVGLEGKSESVAGVLAPPGNTEAITAALSTMLGDKGAREQFAASARRIRDRLPTWDTAAAHMAAALATLTK
jgi:glycosyltransferase involved in cell wall biosynthesis